MSWLEIISAIFVLSWVVFLIAATRGFFLIWFVGVPVLAVVGAALFEVLH